MQPAKLFSPLIVHFRKLNKLLQVMSNPAAVAVPVNDPGDGRWMSMVISCLAV
jgi:hypothetical protein